MCSLSKEQSILSKEIIQNVFFRIIPPFWVYILYQAPQSQVLAPAFGALVNPWLHRYSFWRIENRWLLKILWEKKKLLVTSNFFFSHNFSTQSDNCIPICVHIFDILSLFATESEEPKISIWGKGLTLYQIILSFKEIYNLAFKSDLLKSIRNDQSLKSCFSSLRSPGHSCCFLLCIPEMAAFPGHIHFLTAVFGNNFLPSGLR